MFEKSKLTTAILGAAFGLALAPAAVLAEGKGNSSAHASLSVSESHGNSASNHSAGLHGNGALASELKSMNSAHASDTARLNANAHSRVGMDAAYVQAAKQSADAQATLAAATAARLQAEADLAAAQIELQAAIDAKADTTDAQAKVDAATAKLEAAIADYTAASATYASLSQAEQDALMAVTGGRTLSPEALAQYRAEIGL